MSDPLEAAEQALAEACGVQPRTHRVAVAPQTTIRVLECGSGPPLIFVHGSPNAAPTWLPLASSLPGRRCLFVERPGAGRSDPLTWTRHPDDCVRVLEAVLDHFGLEAADIAGSSLGGRYAYALALARPERVRRLVQLGAPAGPTCLPLPPPFRFLCLPGMGPLVGPLLRPDLAGARKMFADIGHASTVGRMPEALFAWYAALMRSTRTLRNLCAEVGAMATPFGYRAGCALGPADLASIRAPVLYLWGDLDTFATPAQAEALTAATPGARLVRYPGSGHLPWLDDPARVAADMEAFLGG